MKHLAWITPISLLAGALMLALASRADADMLCVECHADVQGGGGFHGSFRTLGGLTRDQLDVICLSCHDGSYTSALGVTAPEAMVHEQPVGGRRLEYGSFKAGCLDCHRTHPSAGGLAGDSSGNFNLNLIGGPVVERNSTDGVARIRKPIIDDNGTPGDTGDDIQAGVACDSSIPDDPTCVADDVREVVFYANITTDGADWAGEPPTVAGRYDGACSACHTRTSHHRRDDSGGDHSHNVTKPCDNCHAHNAGWLNKGG